MVLDAVKQQFKTSQKMAYLFSYVPFIIMTKAGCEVVTNKINLDRCKELRENVCDFALHHKPSDYAEI